MRLISRAALARAAGVSKQAISKACKKDLKPACSGERVDLDHEAVTAYLAAHGRKAPAAPAAPAPQTDASPTPSPKRKATKADAPPAPKKNVGGRPRKPTADPSDEDDDVGHMRPPPGVVEGSSEDLKGLTELLDPLVDRFGTDIRFSDWLSSLKDIELIREKRLKNGETEGGYISRELVKNFVFGALESFSKRLLGDASKAIVTKVANIVRANGSLEEAQRIAREEISKQLKPVKVTAARNLRHKNDGKA